MRPTLRQRLRWWWWAFSDPTLGLRHPPQAMVVRWLARQPWPRLIEGRWVADNSR